MRLTYHKTFEGQKLLQELMALPCLEPVTLPNGEREAVFILCGDGDNIYLDVPDDLTSEQVAEIEQVIANHSPS